MGENDEIELFSFLFRKNVFYVCRICQRSGLGARKTWRENGRKGNLVSWFQEQRRTCELEECFFDQEIDTSPFYIEVKRNFSFIFFMFDIHYSKVESLEKLIGSIIDKPHVLYSNWTYFPCSFIIANSPLSETFLTLLRDLSATIAFHLGVLSATIERF